MRNKYYLLALLCLALLSLSACKKADPEPPETKQPTFRKDGELTITSPQGAHRGTFEIEIAETEASTARGLMFRENLQQNQGMLFIFDGAQPYPFWMKDTYLSLDMLFIDADGVIFQIEEKTTPFSEHLIDVNGLNKYTLEVNAGVVQKLGIQVGDTIEWNRNQ